MESVLNWLWQGSAVALAAAVMLRVLDPSRARVRYRALWVVLLTILLLPFAPFLVTASLQGSSAAGPGGPSAPVVIIPSGWWTSTGAILVLWAAWSLVHAGRVSRAALALRRAKQHCRPVPPGLGVRLRSWSRVSTTGRRAHLVVSDSVKSAALLGGRWPLIALAPALVDRLTDEELDRVVIHEWAHVQRRDDVTHLLQLLVGLVAGWHPAVWWCTRQLNVEREVACDEIAVAITGSAREYAACLTRVASVQSRPLQQLPAAIAWSTSGLGCRVVRILTLDRRAARPTTVTTIAAAMVLGLTAVVSGSYRAIAAGPPTTHHVLPTLPTPPAPIDASSPVRRDGAVESTGPSLPPVGSTPVTERPRRPRVQTLPVQSSPPADATSPAPLIHNPSHEPPPSPLASSAGAAASVIDGPPGLSRPVGSQASSIEASSATIAPPTSQWGAAADAGVAVGRGTQDAAVATAGFFNRLGRRIGGSF